MATDRAPREPRAGDTRAAPRSRGEARTGARFAPTSWRLVERAGRAGRAGEAGGAGDRAALDELLARCWGPAYAFLRRSGFERADAEDLTQGFFARLLEGEWLRRADRARGRFRTFLLTCLARHARDARQRRQDRFERAAVSHDEVQGRRASAAWEPAAGETPEQAYERAWGRALLARVRDGFVDACRAEGKELYVRAREARELHPAEGNAELARRLGVTPNQLKNALAQGRRRYEEALLAEVAAELGTDDRAEVMAEVRRLAGLV